MRYEPKRRVAAALIAFAVLAGCDKKPGGQVVAVVDSQEITQQELWAEAEAAGIAVDRDARNVVPAVLNRVIERNLLADYAREQGLDRGPEYVTRRRQLEQSLLATLGLRKMAGSPVAPNQSEINAFIAQNPAIFAQRERLTLDQIRFSTPADASRIKQLAGLGSIDAIEERLRGDRIPAARAATTLDTGTLESAVARQIHALPNGQTFDLSVDGTTFISAITGRTPAVTPRGGWRTQAAAMMRDERSRKALVDGMAKLRAAAKIEYDPAYRPPAGR